MKKLFLGMLVFFGLCIFVAEVFLYTSSENNRPQMQANVVDGLDLATAPSTDTPELESGDTVEEPVIEETPVPPETTEVLETPETSETPASDTGMTTPVNDEVVTDAPVTNQQTAAVFIPDEKCSEAKLSLEDVIAHRDYIQQEYGKKLEVLRNFEEEDGDLPEEYVWLQAKYTTEKNNIAIQLQVAQEKVESVCN